MLDLITIFYQLAYLRLPHFLPKFFLKFGPQPDLIVLPLRKSSDIHAGKPELTVTEIDEQYLRIQKGCGSNERFIMIDAESGISDVANKIRGLLKI